MDFDVCVCAEDADHEEIQSGRAEQSEAETATTAVARLDGPNEGEQRRSAGGVVSMGITGGRRFGVAGKVLCGAVEQKCDERQEAS